MTAAPRAPVPAAAAAAASAAAAAGAAGAGGPPAGALAFSELKPRIDGARERIGRLRDVLRRYFVAKGDVIDLMVVCAAAQEPLLLVGRPGTAKSDLVVKFAEAIGATGEDYFEYMLTRFTEPGEIIGPIDLDELRAGRYVRRVQGKLPRAQVAFLDEIFKSNSAILNVLLTIINERKYYQDGQPQPVPLKILFAASNDVPELADLAALRDRFTLKVESHAVKDDHFEALLDRGVANDVLRARGERPWAGVAGLDDFLVVKSYLDHLMAGTAALAAGGAAGEAAGGGAGGGPAARPDPVEADRTRYFPAPVWQLFRRVLRTLEKEDKVFVSDRRVIKLYRLLRARAFLLHGGEIGRDDLTLLRWIGETPEHFATLPAKVDALLGLDASP
jgi:MoxR-like ATPase